MRRTVLFTIVCAILCSAAQGGDPARPNILFAIADDWSYSHASAYGCKWIKTPGFDRVAREGILFKNAYTPNAKCAPSRACIITGRNSWQLKEAANHWCEFPPEFKSWPEALNENGYFVGMTQKGWGPGFAKDANGKPRQLTGAGFNKRTAPAPTNGISKNDYAANFEDFLDAAPKDKPWSFWYGCLEPHRGYEYGSGVAKGGKKLSDIDRVPAYWPDNDTVRNDLLDYALEVEHFDHHLARMLDQLDKRGLLENTIIVVTADNGMPFPRAKGQAYDASNHLPLAIMWKRGIKSPGRSVDDYVSFIDFAPTFIEAAALKWEQTGMQPSPGRSLFDIFTSEKSGQVNPARDHVLIGKERHDVGAPNDVGYPIRGIVKGGALYIHNFETSRWPSGNPETGYLNCDGGATKTEILKARADAAMKPFWLSAFGMRPQEEFFDTKNDPDCVTNLAGSADREDLKQKLKQQLFVELKSQDDPRMSGQGEIFDKYPYADAATKDFYERYMRGDKLKAGWVNESDFEKEPVKQN